MCNAFALETLENVDMAEILPSRWRDLRNAQRVRPATKDFGNMHGWLETFVKLVNCLYRQGERRHR